MTGAPSPGETASNPFLRIRTWREKAVPHGHGHDAGIATQLYVECIAFYRHCLRQLSQGPSKTTLTRFTRNYEALVLWCCSYDIDHGGLDETLLSSRRVRRCYLESLTSICTTLLSRVPPLFPTLPWEYDTEALRQTLKAGFVCLEDTKYDGDAIDSSSDTFSEFVEDSIDDVIKDLEIDVDGLHALDSLISCPADRTSDEPEAKARSL